jgi:hypothetical protein
MSIPPVNAGVNAVSISSGKPDAPAYNTRSHTRTTATSVPGSPTGYNANRMGGRKKRRSTNKRNHLKSSKKRVNRRRSIRRGRRAPTRR